jgi:hypothetical protein
MDERQIIVHTSRVLERFEPLRLRMKDSAGNCKIWAALIKKVRRLLMTRCCCSCDVRQPDSERSGVR